MRKYLLSTHYYDFYEYHGNTVIELIRKKAGKTIWRDWIKFNTVDEAMEYFNTECGVLTH